MTTKEDRIKKGSFGLLVMFQTTQDQGSTYILFAAVNRYKKLYGELLMTWISFFKSRSYTYASRAGVAGLIVGTGGTVVMALNIASKCLSVVDLCVSGANKNIHIPEVAAVVGIRNHSTPITFYDINAPFPQVLADVVKQLNQLPVYCFYAPLIIGLCMTMAISLSLASAIAVAIFIKEQDDNAEILPLYSPLPRG